MFKFTNAECHIVRKYNAPVTPRNLSYINDVENLPTTKVISP